VACIDEFNASTSVPLCVAFDENTLVCGTGDNLVHIFSLQRYRDRQMVLEKLRQEEMYSLKKEVYTKTVEAKASKKKKKSVSPKKAK
jgi:hypothetical protein